MIKVEAKGSVVNLIFETGLGRDLQFQWEATREIFALALVKILNQQLKADEDLRRKQCDANYRLGYTDGRYHKARLK